MLIEGRIALSIVAGHEGIKLDFDSFWQNCGLGSVWLWFMVYQIRLNADFSMDDRQQGDVQRLRASTYCFLSFRFSNQIQNIDNAICQFGN